MGEFSRTQRDQQEASAPAPLRAGPVSNGEFVPAAETAQDRAVNKLIRSTIDDSARRLGMDRRRFLQSAGAVAASLAAFELAGCSGPSASSKSPKSGRGGTFSAPSSTDTAACQQALSRADGFILDVHTHHVIPSGPWVQGSPETVDLVLSMIPSGCTDSPQLDCVDRATYLHDLFLASDTTVAVLTDVPNSGPSNAPIPFPEALTTKQVTEGLVHGGASRLLVENIIAPNVGAVVPPSTRCRAPWNLAPRLHSRCIRPGALQVRDSPWKTRRSASQRSNMPTTSESRSSSLIRGYRS